MVKFHLECTAIDQNALDSEYAPELMWLWQ